MATAEGEWHETGRISMEGSPISTLALDSFEELLWMGDDQGNSEGNVIVLKKSRMICGGLDDGTVKFYDPKTLKVENTVSAYSGGITDLDVTGNMLITCGYSHR
ncbi:hypothetical protein HDU93_006293 [Gonapodya sp. JEL0774]|nr:hypothetical protein HDU93_006293 [Gonapodya sp. JEL0774]